LRSWVWWDIPVILALKRLRQEDLKFESSLGYAVNSCLKNKTTPTQKYPKQKNVNNKNSKTTTNISLL
jgi:hypothetical protein